MSATRESEVPACPCSDPGTTHTVAAHWVKAEPTKGPFVFARNDSPVMTAPEPTAEHREVVAEAIYNGTHEHPTYNDMAGAVLTSTDPAVHAALAASLPAEVMLAEREAGAASALWNQANLVGYAIDRGRLDGTNGAAVAAAIRARSPEEFAKACGEVAP